MRKKKPWEVLGGRHFQAEEIASGNALKKERAQLTQGIKRRLMQLGNTEYGRRLVLQKVKGKKEHVASLRASVNCQPYDWVIPSFLTIS